ncbi:MAG: hypothetical protein DRI61_05275 [Chloroflexi bacterium]|nr:MAG: hypothetical protein DRI61_05275 [Chloroflexota bacterium]
MGQERIGKVVISPRVLKTIARLTALSNPDVVRLALPGLFKFHIPSGGVAVRVEGNTVSINLHIVANARANMYELGRNIQKEITRAIQNIVGMQVKEVNVYIEGVGKSRSAS